MKIKRAILLFSLIFMNYSSFCMDELISVQDKGKERVDHENLCAQEATLLALKLLQQNMEQQQREIEQQRLEIAALKKNMHAEPDDSLPSSYIKEKNASLDAIVVDNLIHTAPARLQGVIRIIKSRDVQTNNLYPIPRLHAYVFVGPSGTGKSSLAEAIMLHCQIPYNIINATLLANEYQNSGSSNLERSLHPVFNKSDVHGIIIDELHSIVKKSRLKDGQDDISAAEALWTLLDTCEQKNNLLLLATTNDIECLPEQLRSRLAGAMFFFKQPTLQSKQNLLT